MVSKQIYTYRSLQELVRPMTPHFLKQSTIREFPPIHCRLFKIVRPSIVCRQEEEEEDEEEEEAQGTFAPEGTAEHAIDSI